MYENVFANVVYELIRFGFAPLLFALAQYAKGRPRVQLTLQISAISSIVLLAVVAAWLTPVTLNHRNAQQVLRQWIRDEGGEVKDASRPDAIFSLNLKPRLGGVWLNVVQVKGANDRMLFIHAGMRIEPLSPASRINFIDADERKRVLEAIREKLLMIGVEFTDVKLGPPYPAEFMITTQISLASALTKQDVFDKLLLVSRAVLLTQQVLQPYK